MNFPLINFTPDLVIIAVIAVLVAYGLLLGQNKLKTLALSAYVGIVIATEVGPVVAQLVPSSSGWLSANVVRLGLFALPLVLLELGRRSHSRREHGGMIMTLVLGVLTALLVTASGLALLDDQARAGILGSSWLATTILGLRLWWIGLVPLAVIGESFVRPRER